MAGDEDERFEPADCGLTDPDVLEAAMRMAPVPFIVLRISHVLDSSYVPIRSDAAIERASRAVADEDDHGSFDAIVAGAYAALWFTSPVNPTVQWEPL